MASISYLQVNRICNQCCLFCSNPDSGLTLPLADAKEIVDRFVAEKADGLIITGGEPTLYEPLLELISYAKSRGIPPRISTNGQKTADFGVLAALKAAGLNHIHLSLHSNRNNVQTYLSGNPDSLKNVTATLVNADRLGMRVDVSTTICRQNAAHLHETVEWICSQFGFVSHFSWTNLDPFMNRVAENRQVVPRLADLEISLLEAMRMLDRTGRTFRVEKVPLCYMGEFAHCSTETRRIVKDEVFVANFLDYRNFLKLKKYSYNKAAACEMCSLSSICAGLWEIETYYSPAELRPLETDPAQIIDEILHEFS